MIKRLPIILLILCGLLLPLALPMAPASADDTILTGLEAFWELDEESGTRNDSHGANDLTDNNTVGYTASGIVGNAALFTAANSEYLSIADNAALSVGAGISFTACGWVYLTALPANQSYVFSKTNEYNLLVYSSGQHAFYCPGKTLISKSGFTTTAWHHFCIWYDAAADTGNYQADMGSVSSASWTDIADTGTVLTLGNRDGYAYFVDGLIDEVGFWKRVLTADERTWLYNSGAGRSYAELVAAAATPTPTPTSTPTATATGILAGTPAAYSVIMPSGQTGTMYATVSAGEGFAIVLQVAIVLLLGYQAVSAAAEKWKEK